MFHLAGAATPNELTWSSLLSEHKLYAHLGSYTRLLVVVPSFYSRMR